MKVSVELVFDLDERESARGIAESDHFLTVLERFGDEEAADLFCRLTGFGELQWADVEIVEGVL